MAGFGEERDGDDRNSGAVAEEVKRLNVAGVVVAAALVEGDEDGGATPQRGIGFDGDDDFFDEAFEEVKFR